uniref:Lactamase_B domain-containing protein n=1 Tax=Wuchereria bancrofti TaxID=6293 RepID=A0A1I8EVQ9_WUCBA
MLCYSTAVLFLLVIFTLLSVNGEYSIGDKTDHLKTWIETNRNSFPQPITDDLISSISGNNDIATAIFKIFGFGSEPKISEAKFTETTGLPTSSLCPFDADPLILSGEYSYCKPTTVGECPSGFVCDFSLVLGRSICCQDMRNEPIINIRVKPPTNSISSLLLATHSSRLEGIRTREHIWSTTVANRRSPWYIRNRRPLYRTSWNGTAHSFVPSRTMTASTTLIPKSHELPPTEPTGTDSEEVSIEGHISTADKITLTEQQEIPHRNISEFGIISMKSVQTTFLPSLTTSSISAVRPTSVSLIQIGNIKRLTDKQMLIVGTITLINDQGYRILVDTGSAADTESLLQEVWKTPGSTQQSLSVLVYNVEGYGTMAVVGDLIPTEDYVFNRTNSNVDLDKSVWDSLIRRQNSNLIVCLADWIIPGHGQPFRAASWMYTFVSTEKEIWKDVKDKTEKE